MTRKDFKYWTHTVLPLVYDESLSYYEVVVKVTKALQTIAEQIEDIDNITTEAVREVLDEMIEGGELADIISEEVIGNLTDRVSNLETAVDDIEEALTPEKNYVFIGDSWALGYIDGIQSTTGWPDRVKTLLRLDDDHYHKIAREGCGFHVSSENNFANLIDSNYSSVPNRDTVTDIVVGACLNDTYDYSYNNVANGLGQFSEKCRQYFPNAKITLFAIGWSMFASRKLNLENVFYVYERACPGVGITYVDGGQYIVVDGNHFPASNGSHVDDEGQLLVARGVTNYLREGTIGESIHRTAEVVKIKTPDGDEFDFAEVSYAMRRKFIKFSNTSINYQTPITVRGWNATDLGEITSNCLQGTNGALTTIPTTLRLKSGTVYRTIPAALAFIQNVNDWHKVTVRLYAYITNEAGNLDISNVDQVRLSTNSLELTPYLI